MKNKIKNSKIKKIINNILQNSKIINTLMAFISYYYLCTSGVLKSYNVESWLILAVLIIAFCKVDLLKIKKSIIIFSAFFSLIFIYGKTVYGLMYSKELTIFKEFFTFRNLKYGIGIFCIILLILSFLIPKLLNYKFANNFKSKIKKTKWVFIISFIVIFMCWIPYFLRLFPGTLSPDSFGELSTVIGGFSSVSDHHPVLHMLFIAIPYNIGFAIFKTYTAGVAFYSITQMICMASIFAYSIVFLYKRKVKDIFLLIVLLYYAIAPMHGYYSVVMWKDVMFAGMMLLFIMQCIKIYEYYLDDCITIKKLVPFVFVSIICIFFRNNAIYMYMILFVVSIIMFRKYYKVLLVCFIVVISFYYIVKYPIFNILNIKRSESAEYIAMPLQQIGRMAYKEMDFTAEEKDIINELIPIDVMKTVYKPKASDYIKFNDSYNDEYFDAHKFEFLKLWLNLTIKHPELAIESYSVSTIGYWYPGLEFWSVYSRIDNNNYGLETNSLAPKFVEDYIDKVSEKDVPIFSIEWSIALCFWIILIFEYVAVKKKNIIGLYPYIPIIGIWLTLMIASPVYGEFRYVYNVFACLPILLLFPYIRNYQKSK